jgi:DNA-binding transcriptional MerR regulator
MSASSGRAPEKSPEAFRTISEVSEELGLPQHVLRFWETRFAQVKPMKRSGGRRLYRPDHVALLRGIKALLYDDGMTIKGVQKMLRESGARTVIARGKADAALSLEMTEHAEASTPEGMLPLELPENAAERLAALKDRVSGQRAPAPQKVDTERVRRSIGRLEALLVELEGGAGERA